MFSIRPMTLNTAAKIPEMKDDYRKEYIDSKYLLNTFPVILENKALYQLEEYSSDLPLMKDCNYNEVYLNRQ